MKLNILALIYTIVIGIAIALVGSVLIQILASWAQEVDVVDWLILPFKIAMLVLLSFFIAMFLKPIKLYEVKE